MCLLFVKELKKILFNRILLIIFVISLIYPVSRIINLWKNGNIVSKASKDFYKVNPTDYTRIDIDELEKETDRLAELFFSGEKSKEVTEYYPVYERALKNIEYLQAYNEKMHSYVIRLRKEYLGSRDKKDAEILLKEIDLYNRKRRLKLVDTNSYQDFFTFFHKYDVNVSISLMMILMTLSATVLIFHQDRLFRAESMAFTSLRGRKTLFFLRLLSLICFIILMCILEFVVEIIIAKKIFGVNSFDASLQSLPQYFYTPFDISVLDYIFICCMLRLAVLFFAAGSCLIFNFLANNPVRPLILGIFFNIAIPYYFMDRYLNAGLGGYETVQKVNKIRTLCPFCLLVPDYYYTGFDVMKIFEKNFFRFTTVLFICIFIFLLGAGINLATAGRKER